MLKFLEDFDKIQVHLILNVSLGKEQKLCHLVLIVQDIHLRSETKQDFPTSDVVTWMRKIRFTIFTKVL